MSSNEREILRRLAALEERMHAVEIIERIQTTPGVWTPSYYGGTTVGTTTYSAQVGYYIRLGPMIGFTGYVNWTNATGTGTVRLGLPATSANVVNQQCAAWCYTESVTFAQSGVQCFIAQNSAEMRLFSPQSNVASTELNIEVAGAIRYGGLFFV